LQLILQKSQTRKKRRTNGMNPNLAQAINETVPASIQKLADTERKIGDIITWCQVHYVNETQNRNETLDKTKEYTNAVLHNVLYYVHAASVDLMNMLDLQAQEVDKLNAQMVIMSDRLRQVRAGCGRDELLKMQSVQSTSQVGRKKRKVKERQSELFNIVDSKNIPEIHFDMYHKLGIPLSNSLSGQKTDTSNSNNVGPRELTIPTSPVESVRNSVSTSSTFVPPSLDIGDIPIFSKKTSSGPSYTPPPSSPPLSTFSSNNSRPAPPPGPPPLSSSSSSSSSSAPPPPPPPGPPPPVTIRKSSIVGNASGDGDLLDSIRAGKELKKVELPNEDTLKGVRKNSTSDSPTNRGADGVDMMAAIMAKSNSMQSNRPSVKSNPVPPASSPPAPSTQTKPPPPPGPPPSSAAVTPPPPSGGPPPPPPGPPPPAPKAGPAPKLGGGDPSAGRGDLLSSIRAGKTLRKVPPPDDNPLKNYKGGGSSSGGSPLSSSPSSPQSSSSKLGGGGGGDMMSMIMAQRNALKSRKQN